MHGMLHQDLRLVVKFAVFDEYWHVFMFLNGFDQCFFIANNWNSAPANTNELSWSTPTSIQHWHHHCSHLVSALLRQAIVHLVLQN
jgi:hypothetical protein